MKRTILRVYSMLLSLLIVLPLGAQNGSGYKERAARMKEAYRQKSKDMGRAYREKSNAMYQEYLARAWEMKNGIKPIEKPQEEEIPPVVIPENEPAPVPQNNPVPFTEPQPQPSPTPSPTPVYPIKEVPQVSPESCSFEFYGTGATVRFAGAETMKGTTPDDVSRLWGVFGAEKYDNMLYDCLAIRANLLLCDWAYIGMVDAFTAKVYGAASAPEAVVLQSYILTNSGFMVYFARDSKGGLHKLVAMDRDLYGYPYWVVNGKHCFLLDGCTEDSMQVVSRAFEGTTPMSLSPGSGMKLAGKSSSPRTLTPRDNPSLRASVSSNLNLIDFYNGYPESVQGDDFTTRWRLYANTPLSAQAQNGLYPALRQAIQGKSELDMVEVLLNFVQTAFEYKYDDKVWGRDRVFFADETLYYPYCDCEDRAILFSRLVRDLVGLDVVLLYYPGHLATAVCFRSQVTGDYLTIYGKRYVVCDPTYIGAPVGLTMSKMDNSTAVVVKL